MLQPAHRHLLKQFNEHGYIAEDELVSSLYLMDVLQKPLLIEGEAGVGKTEIAQCLAQIHQTELLRLQCYEGLDSQNALYEWDYPRQLLAIQQVAEKQDSPPADIYSDAYLVKRPLFQAITSPSRVVLLIDEVDRADEEFEALLLELLADFQVTVPELGTFTAKSKPLVILTSNGVRELSDALRRRCLYHYISYPTFDKELAIVHAKLPDIELQFARQIVAVVQNLRNQTLRKTPGIAETLDWAAALLELEVRDLAQLETTEIILQSMASLIKTREDAEFVRSGRFDLRTGTVSDNVSS